MNRESQNWGRWRDISRSERQHNTMYFLISAFSSEKKDIYIGNATGNVVDKKFGILVNETI